MKKMIVCAVIAGLFSGVASAESKGAIAGEAFGATAIYTVVGTKVMDSVNSGVQQKFLTDDVNSFSFKNYSNLRLRKQKNIELGKNYRKYFQSLADLEKQLIDVSQDMKQYNFQTDKLGRLRFKNATDRDKYLELSKQRLGITNQREALKQDFKRFNEENLEVDIGSRASAMNDIGNMNRLTETDILKIEQYKPNFKKRYNQQKSALEQKKMFNEANDGPLEVSNDPNALKDATDQISEGAIKDVIDNTGTNLNENENVEETNVKNASEEENSDLEKGIKEDIEAGE